MWFRKAVHVRSAWSYKYCESTGILVLLPQNSRATRLSKWPEKLWPHFPNVRVEATTLVYRCVSASLALAPGVSSCFALGGGSHRADHDGETQVLSSRRRLDQHSRASIRVYSTRITTRAKQGSLYDKLEFSETTGHIIVTRVKFTPTSLPSTPSRRSAHPSGRTAPHRRCHTLRR